MEAKYKKPSNANYTVDSISNRKLTPYNKFVKKMSKELRSKFPNDSAPEIMKKIGAEWRKTK